MELINSLAIFSIPKEIFLRDLLHLPIRPQMIQKAPLLLAYGEEKEDGHKLFDYLNLVKETLKTCKGEVEVSTQKTIQEMDKVM